MSDFQKAVSVLRSQGIGVSVKNNETSNIQVATIIGENLTGGFASHTNVLLFNDEEVSIIRELLSHMTCDYSNKIIAKIDAFKG